jgi:hypothetical protein
MLGEDDLALLMRRFERLHENRVNMRRNTRTWFQCGKPGHFIADYPEKVENKDGYKHKSRTDGKYRSRRDHKSKHKNKHKDERRSRKKESQGKVFRADFSQSSGVDRLQDENGELRKLMGWLFGYEPQLRIMIETFKRQNGEGLGSNKVGEGSRENILEPPKPTTKMISLLSRLSKLNLVRGLPRLRLEKELVCAPCRHAKGFERKG